MKEVAAIILNRNLPELADELGEWVLAHNADLVDLYGVENGSDPDKYSKFANIFFKESLGAARGMNEALKLLLKKPYEYFWLNFNDARYPNSGFLSAAINAIDKNRRIGIFTGFWEGNVRVYGKKNGTDILSLFEILGLVVTRKALIACQNWPRVNLDPLLDSSNYTGHYNTLATTLALYESGLCVAADERFPIYERREVADENSELARGHSDDEWKNVIGPADMQAWLDRAFPDIKGTPKEVRAKIRREITMLVSRNFPDVEPIRENSSFVNKLAQAIIRPRQEN